MYSHYLATSIGIRDTWWKPHLTKIQIFQFILNILMTIAAEAGVCGPDFNFPVWLSRGMIAYMSSLLFLFLNFYLSSYLMGSGRRQPVGGKPIKPKGD
jgi:hypothetical protein